MNESRTLPTTLESRNTTTGCSTTIKVVALYDGFTSAVYAHEAVGSLAMTVRPLMHVENCLWSFDMLARLDVRHPSIRVAAEADVIIVAGEASRRLPDHVRTWLIHSLRENGKGTPLIVVIDEGAYDQGDEAPPPLHEDLASIAGQWGTPLLRNGEFDSRLERDLGVYLAARGESRTGDTALDGPRAAYAAGRWGINE